MLRYLYWCVRGKCLKLIYLTLLASGFILLSYQLQSGQSFAKAIPPNANFDDQDHAHGNFMPLHALPIMKNEEGDGMDSLKEQNLPEVNIVPINGERSLHEISKTLRIGDEKYPKLSQHGKFIPIRRIIHLDLKGGAFKPEFFTELFYFFKRIKATGILLEWEDMFPYKGQLSDAVNGNAYSMEDVESILKEAQRHHLQVIPLVQTFGHLEWILKLEKFAHLREDDRFPQVICFPEPEAWKLITDMIEQVAAVHSKFGMPFFHMGADEVFQLGVCNASVAELGRQGSRDNLMLWHISRTATFIKEKYNTTVLAWHDMLAQVMESDLLRYNVPQVLEPVLWSYAEDLNMYLPRSTWSALSPFPRVWGSSAWKGADGPARFNSNPIHYIRNHESWIEQFSSVYKDFDTLQGLIMTGWSRYDHLSVLAELLPVAIPGLAMSMETMLEGRPLVNSYTTTSEILQCTPPAEMGFAFGCQFPGRKVYELINDLWQRRKQLREYQEDYELNGWLSRVADTQLVSSRWYIDKVQPVIESLHDSLQDLEKNLRMEMANIYFQDTIDEFVFTYLSGDMEWLSKKLETAKKINRIRTFMKRPLFSKG